ncbi:MAG: hypothetical protein ACRENB_15100 [Gemmatimonadales bacterium]
MLPLPETATATRKRIAQEYKRLAGTASARILHVRSGDDILEKLAQGGVAGDTMKWADPLCEGPIPPLGDDARFRRVRAAYLARRYAIPVTEAARELLGEDLRLASSSRYEEIVLWFEADLFDQMILVHLLARLPGVAGSARVSLICIGSFPRVRRFIGLGQLDGGALATLLPRRKPVTPGHARLAREVCAAVQSDDPRELLPFTTMRSRSLPFLPAALRRYLEEFPRVGDGLSRTERLALEETAKAGEIAPIQLFPRVQDRERRPFMGDTMFYAVVHDLTSGPAPLLSMDAPAVRSPGEISRIPVRLTDDGRRVLRGRADWRRLNGVGKWIGGVHLRGSGQIWRWSPARGRVVRAGA